MRFGVIGAKRPEAFPRLFRIYRHDTATSARGRERDTVPTILTEARCILSIASPDEQLRFHQLGVTVTHTIFHPGKPIAKPNDVFALVEGDTERRYFRVEAVHDHGDMSVFTTYYCEERGDINGNDD